ncbi:MAG TPA: hypothetical protein VJ733_07485, partial [Candidatus Binatia bacterium]|nr:hypothetical protein [Candidatus Binatia bacterium]
SDLLELTSWSRRKTEIVVPTAADKTDGTIAVTNGAAAIVGTSTSFATTDEGRYIIMSDDTNALYVLKSRTSTTGISLGDLNGTSVLYPGTTASGLTHTIFTRWYSLTAGIEQILGVAYQGKIEEVSQEYLDWLDPSRSATGTPIRFCRGPRDMSGANDIVRLEFHPRPSSPISIRVAVQLGHTDLSGTQNPIVPSQPIEWLSAEHTCLYLFSKTKEEKWMVLAAAYQKRGAIALEKAIEEDQKKFGVIQQVQDRGGNGLAGTDFGLDHDV